jgi:hypothetical protein
LRICSPDSDVIASWPPFDWSDGVQNVAGFIVAIVVAVGAPKSLARPL